MILMRWRVREGELEGGRVGAGGDEVGYDVDEDGRVVVVLGVGI